MTEFQIKQEDADRRLLQEFVSENYANRNNNNDILYENLDTLRTRASNFQNFQNLNNRVTHFSFYLCLRNVKPSKLKFL